MIKHLLFDNYILCLGHLNTTSLASSFWQSVDALLLRLMPVLWIQRLHTQEYIWKLHNASTVREFVAR